MTQKMNDNDALLQEKEAIIAQKEQDMRAMEKRYKTYRESWMWMKSEYFGVVFFKKTLFSVEINCVLSGKRNMHI